MNGLMILVVVLMMGSVIAFCKFGLIVAKAHSELKPRTVIESPIYAQGLKSISGWLLFGGLFLLPFALDIESAERAFWCAVIVGVGLVLRATFIVQDQPQAAWKNWLVSSVSFALATYVSWSWVG